MLVLSERIMMRSLNLHLELIYLNERIKIIGGEETKFIELKKEYSDSLLKTVSAFANYHDGKIILGIDDTGEVTGVANISRLRLNIENAINDNIHPRPYFEMALKEIAGKVVLLIKVLKGDYLPYYYKNKAYKRSDTSSVEVDRFELGKLILEGQNFSYEDLESKNQELEFDYLEKKFREKKKISSLSTDILKSLELIKNEKYINAASLLSDGNPLENSSIVLLKYSKELMNINDRLILNRISIIEQFDQCMNFYYKHISVQETINGPYRQTREEIPAVAYREAVANAIIHRDYMAPGDIKIEIFEDRVEIVSPGGLPAGISEEEYVEGRLSVMRNRIIADIFLRLGMIEKLATGIRRIKEYYIGYLHQPEFSVKQNSIKVVLPKANAEKVEEPSGIEYSVLYGDERTIVDYIKQHEEITRKTAEDLLKKGKTQTYKTLKNLLERRYIVSLGRGKNTRYLLMI